MPVVAPCAWRHAACHALHDAGDGLRSNLSNELEGSLQHANICPALAVKLETPSAGIVPRVTAYFAAHSPAACSQAPSEDTMRWQASQQATSQPFADERARDMRTSSESRMQTALLSCAPPVIIHAAPTASPRATCMDYRCIGARRSENKAQHPSCQPCRRGRMLIKAAICGRRAAPVGQQ